MVVIVEHKDAIDEEYVFENHRLAAVMYLYASEDHFPKMKLVNLYSPSRKRKEGWPDS